MEKSQNPNSMNSPSTTTGVSLSQPDVPNSSPNTETLATESNPDPPSVDPAAPSNGSPEDPKPANEAEEEEEEEECGFCLFMKGGGCKDPFVEWEKCVEDAERFGEDIAEKCFDITHKLRVCMEAHSDYYEPLLRAEKSMMEEAEAKENHDTADSAKIVVMESELETKSSKKAEAEDVAVVVVEKPAQLADVES